MPRLATSLIVLAAAVGSGPALAADWNTASPEDIYRGAYSVEPQDWTELGDESDGIHMETGLRYWYSWGSQSFDLGGENFSESDNAHSVEAHLRIEDDATSTYGKAWVGYTAAITGEHTGPDASGQVVDGVLGYGGADFGWNVISDGKSNGAGVFVGYNYWNNSPRTSRANFTTATADGAESYYDPDTGIWSLPGDSVDDKFELHMLRLGISGKAEINEMFDISGEVAAVPFATISGVMGGHTAGLDGDLGPYAGCDIGDPCGTYSFKGSQTDIEGWGYGAMGEVMAGFHPMENLVFRVGGRAWWVNGTYDATWREVSVVPPVEQPWEGDPPAQPDPAYSPPDISEQNVISTENPFSMFRYGLLAELTYSF